jgi:hypothetical protein
MEVATGRIRFEVQPGAQAVAMAFCPDGSLLAAACTDGRIRVYRSTDGRASGELSDPAASAAQALAFSWDGRRLAWGDGHAAVKVGELPSGPVRRVEADHRMAVLSLAFHPDGRTLVSASADTTFRVADPDTGRLLATGTTLDGGQEWLVTSPEGFFDGSAGGQAGLRWRLGRERFLVEQFYQEFFEPGLLHEVFQEARPVPDLLRQRKDLRADLRLQDRDRRLCQVGFEGAPAAKEGLAVVRLRVAEAPAGAGRAQGSGVQDVRLFRNGTLAARWAGSQAGGVLTAEIPLATGTNRLSAYAFNRDNVKCPDSRIEVQGPAKPPRPPRAFLVNAGIDRYLDPRLDLRFAASDARALQEALRQNLPFPAEEVDATLLVDTRATRAGLVQALEGLARSARPEDTVVVSFAGHGFRRGERFYLVPQDVSLQSAGAEATGCLSDLDLERLLAPVQADRIVLILDSCHSGQTLEAGDWRQGPWNNRGLAQMAWEKGLEVITASQPYQSALETWSLGHGLLTYALVEEGFTRAPRRKGLLLARDWLDFAADRVPQLLLEGQARTLGVAPAPAASQVPRVFHRREGGGDWTVGRER